MGRNIWLIDKSKIMARSLDQWNFWNVMAWGILFWIVFGSCPRKEKLPTTNKALGGQDLMMQKVRMF